MLLPALVSAATGYLAFVAINGTERLFPIAGEPNFNFRDLMGALALGVAAGLAARAFSVMVLKAKELTRAAQHLATPRRGRGARRDLRDRPDRDG